MTYENFIHYVHQPDTLTETQIPELKELVERFPYFGLGRWLYLKSLHAANSIYFASELSKTALYTQNRRNLYFFIHPDELTTPGNKRRDRNGNATGSYFDMLDVLDNKGENNHQSLKSLAERLKAAREMLHVNLKPEQENKVQKESIDENQEINTPEIKEINAVTANDESFETREELAIKCIQEKKYHQAIEILRELNLNNPKKSIYFADQIRFLEKIIQTNIK